MDNIGGSSKVNEFIGKYGVKIFNHLKEVGPSDLANRIEIVFHQITPHHHTNYDSAEIGLIGRFFVKRISILKDQIFNDLSETAI